MRWQKKWALKYKNNAYGGFTYIELSVALVIIGIMLFAIIPSFLSFFDSDLTNASKKLSALIHFAKHEAMMKKKPLNIIFDFQTNEYWIETRSFDSQDTFDNITSFEKNALPSNLKFYLVHTPSAKFMKGKGCLKIFKGGFVEGGIICLAMIDSKNRETIYGKNSFQSLEVLPFTGKIKIHKGLYDKEY